VGATAESSALPNPLRSLGDTLKEIRRRFDQIGDAPKAQPSPSLKVDETAPPSQVEYLQEGMDEDHDIRALGPAKEDQVVKLSELKISEDQPPTEIPNKD
jgi:midasin